MMWAKLQTRDVWVTDNVDKKVTVLISTLIDFFGSEPHKMQSGNPNTQ